MMGTWLVTTVYLVGGLEHEFYDFPYLGNVIILTDELIFFRGVENTNQLWLDEFSDLHIQFFSDLHIQFFSQGKFSLN